MLENDYTNLGKERGKRLKLLRKMSGLTLQELAKRYDLGVSTIKYWECAKNNGLSAKGAKKIIAAMHQLGIHCTYMWLMHGVGLAPQFIDTRCHHDVKDLVSVEYDSYEEEKAIACEVDLFCAQIATAITLTVFDDGMEPLYVCGDTVGGRCFYGNDLVKAIGKDCIVKTEDNQLLCRRVAQSDVSDSFNLYSDNSHTKTNPPHLYAVKLISAAPISRVWKRV